MALEAATTVEQLVVANPLPDDSRGEGDDHIRMLKVVLKGLLPGVPGFGTPQVVQIIGGQISLTSAIVFLQSEVANNPDSINKINIAGTNLGHVVYLRANSEAEPISVDNLASGSGRIITDQGASHVMASQDDMICLFRDSSDRWRELFRKPALVTLAEYNRRYPVGHCIFRRNTSNPNADVPANLQATVVWTMYSPSTADRFLLLTAGTPGVEAGTGPTSTAAPNHTHGPGTYAVATGSVQCLGQSPGANVAPASTGAGYAVNGNSGAAGGHTHDVNPYSQSLRMWFRSA